MRFVVRGGKPLEGEIALGGAKNAATKMLVASLLTDEPCRFTNIPRIGDIDVTLELCRTVGSVAEFKEHTITIHTPEIASSRVPELSRRNRIPILAIGPLLARTGRAEVPILGGDRIGPRPVDLHLKALRALGAEIEINPTSYRAVAKNGLSGAGIPLEFPSVGATENTVLAAVLASGKTVIRNAALEPEIMALVEMLKKMGAAIEIGPNREVQIDGVDRLRGVDFGVPPDRNEAASFACLAIATEGRVLVKAAVADHLAAFLDAVRRLGGAYEALPAGIAFFRNGPLKPLAVETAPHPGFMTDWQQPLAVVLTQAEGASRIHETIYEDRFGYLKDLTAMGARATVFPDCPEDSHCRFYGKEFDHVAVIEGPTSLHGAELAVRDLRAGMVNVIAALAAKGESVISGVEEIDRGYERIDERLKTLGADIKRIE